MIGKSPFTINAENLSIREVIFNLQFVRESIALLDNSNNIYFKVYVEFAEKQRANPNVFDADFLIKVFDAVIDDVIILLEVKGRIFKNEPIEAPKDLWIMVDKTYSLIQQEINDKGVKDKMGGLIKLPHFSLPSFDGIEK